MTSKKVYKLQKICSVRPVNKHNQGWYRVILCAPAEVNIWVMGSPSKRLSLYILAIKQISHQHKGFLQTLKMVVLLSCGLM